MPYREDEDGFSDLVGVIGSAALDEARWPEVLRGIMHHTDASAGHLARQNERTGQAQGFSVGVNPDATKQFYQYYSARNVLRQHSERPSAYGRGATTVRPRVRDLFVRSEYYNDYMLRFDSSSVAWVFLEFDGTYQAVISVLRPERRERFETPEVDRLTRLMPHLMQSYAISRRLGGIAARQDTLGQYLEPLPHGVVLLDAFGRILHANRVARTIAAAGDGFAFTRDGIAAPPGQANDRLQAAIRRAADPRCRPRAARSVRLPRRDGASPYAVAVCPLDDGRAPLVFGRPSVLVEIRDLDSAHPVTDAWLAECLDLTPAESRVAGLLATGLDTFAIASRLRISRSTVRTYLEQLMSKTGTHRQAELVRQIGQAAALYRESEQEPGS